MSRARDHGGSTPDNSALIRQTLPYLIAVAAIVGAFFWRRSMVTYLGAELPAYITFYPAVMVVAILYGLGPGLVATAAAALLAIYFRIPPRGTLISVALFSSMGAFMSVVAELYRRARRKAAAYEKQLALQETQEALQDSETRYRTLFDTLIEGFCIIEVLFDPDNRPIDYRFLEINPAFEAQTGLHGARGKLIRDLIPDLEAHWFEIYGKIALTGEPARFENEAKALNRWYEVFAYRVGGPESRKVAILFNDITERKKMEEELARLATFPKLSPYPIAELDLAGRPCFLNPAAQQLFPDLEQRQLEHPWLADWESLVAAVCKNETKIHFRDVSIGDTEYLQTIYHVPETKRIRIYGLDITARKRAEEALRQSEERLSSIISSAMDAIITLDQDLNVVVFNDAAEKIFGCSASEVLGKPLDRFLPLRLREIHRGHIQKFANTGVTPRSISSLGTLYGLRANGEEFPVEATISQASAGGQKLYSVILRDITQRKQSEEVARLYIKTRELDQFKTEFFANISHELRTPLALILGPVRKWLASGGLGEAEKRDLELVERNARLLLRHVNDLLDLSKLDAGCLKAEYATTDLAKLGRVVASNFEALASERRLSYQVDIHGSLSAEVDAPKIERVLVNLLSNAFKFTPTGGSVRFAIQRKDDRAVVEVEDSGPGVPPDLREAIFERFRQVDGGANRQFGGTGLGLSIAKQFVSLHGGSIAVGEAANGGAIFRIELPLMAPAGSRVLATAEVLDADAARQAAEELAVRKMERPPPAAAPAATMPLVLVIEDNPDMNAFVSETLSKYYRTVAAFDGEEGLSKALEVRPDLILCDIMMPGMSGDQLVRELRNRQELQEVPIVLLTAKTDDRLLAQLLKEGAQDYLQKPFVAEQLLAKLERLFADRRQAAEELERLRQVSRRLLQASDRERRAIAHELHENLAQYIAALEMKVSEARKVAVSPIVQSLLAEAHSLLELCCSEIRTMAYALHPSVLDYFGLEPAIKSYVQSFIERSGMEVTLDVPAGLGRLPDELEATLFRVLQEALSDLRDGGRKKATVRLFCDAEEVGLEVSERNGDGLPLEEQKARRGLQSAGITAMRERVRVLGGQLEVSCGGNGAVVRAVLPVTESRGRNSDGPGPEA